MTKNLRRYHIIAVLAVLIMMLTAGAAHAASDEIEYNNHDYQANYISMGDTIYGVTDDWDYDDIHTGKDWFRFTAPVNGTAYVFIKADYIPYSFTSAELNVYDSGKNELARAYDDGSQWGGEKVRFGVSAGRTYYVRVYGDYGNFSTPDVEYHFKVGYSIGKTAITSKKGSKRAFTIRWSRKANASYYQVQYTKKSRYNVYGWNGAKKVTAKSCSRKIKGLKRRTSYRTRVRVVRKINGVTYYSPWSSAKTVKTK